MGGRREVREVYSCWLALWSNAGSRQKRKVEQEVVVFRNQRWLGRAGDLEAVVLDKSGRQARSSSDGYWAQPWATNTRHRRIHSIRPRRRHWVSILSLASTSFSKQSARLSCVFFDACAQLECLCRRRYFSLLGLWSISEPATHQQETIAQAEAKSDA